jgi:hypothetical protein
MPNRAERDWQAPNFERSDEDKLGWVKEAIADGEKWVKGQCNEADISRGIDVLAGRGGDKVSLKWSQIHTGDLSRAIREIIETLSNIRLSFSGFQTGNSAFLDHADMMNKVTQILYSKYFVDRSLRDALQYAALTGAGFISPYVDRSRYGSGRTRFVFEPLSQSEVLPVQLPKNRDYQEAYVVTIARMMGVAKAHALFPAYQAYLKPFARKKLKGGESGRMESRRTSARWQQHSTDELLEQYCEIFFTYILDLRINEGYVEDFFDGEKTRTRPKMEELEVDGKKILQPTGQVIPMGQPNTSWFYEVPFTGKEISKWEDGRQVKRPAGDDDCRMYPQRRLMISCDAALMYDGPAFDWHGNVPLVPFYLNDWAWEGTGYSLFAQTAPLQDGIDMLERSCNRIAMARANPGKAVNMDSMSKEARLSSRQAELLDPFDPNGYFPMDGDIKEPPMKPPMPEWCYNIPEWVPGTIERLRESINRTLGLDQIQSLQKLRANIQSPEKLLEAEGPVVIGTSRSMERGFKELAEMTKHNVLQYMPTGVIIQYIGADQVPHQVFDYDPNSIIPSHMPGEVTITAEDGSTPESQYGRSERARMFAENIEYVVTPHSLHEIAQNKERLNLLALMGRGPDVFPVDPETLANKFDVAHWGHLDGSTIKEKVESYLKEKLLVQAKMKKLADAEGLTPQEPPGKSTGRPSSGKENPKMKQKGIGNSTPGRAVVSTSG